MVYRVHAAGGIIMQATCPDAVSHCIELDQISNIRPRDCKKNFMLNSAEYEIFPAHKC